MPPERLTLIAAMLAAPHSRRMVPILDWWLLEGPRGHRERMEHYAKQNPVFVGSLFPELSIWQGRLDKMLSWVYEMVIGVYKSCTQPMLLLTLKMELSYTGQDISTSIPRYPPLHDPTCTGPPMATFPPLRSVPDSTANPQIWAEASTRLASSSIWSL
ncbi:hypothetical protein BDN72DRAFT_851486 [Pluteus cervinus]|uniref:Uncharacterized protein n=1 Tax=Pluteus cervinus TaxID=181527 RepID=A0ACD3A2C1_9AGAR|nr:hypothetical protein BDN72DRAFT_851486 [Pluteus cervinus]